MDKYLNASRSDLNEKVFERLSKQYGIVERRLKEGEGKRTRGNVPLDHEVSLLKKFFLPESEQEQDPHAFGTVEISHRIKSLDSIKKNIVSGLKAGASNADAAKKAKELEDTLAFLLESDKPSEWCKHLRDFIGVRVIVRSQRNKYQIYRAIRYLCELNQTERRESLGIPFVTTEPKKTWKYFNPPVMRAYYRPVVVQEFHEVIKDITSISAFEGQLDHDSEKFLNAIRKLDISTRHDISFEFKNTGYATLQRNLYFQIQNVAYLFELQIRTALEHAWAEPEHKMIYKGEPLSEHVKGLFRNYGLSLSSADDILQFVMDEWRRETDYRADYSERSLRIFEHYNHENRIQRGKVNNKDIILLYDSLSHGYVNDAISIAQSLVKQQEPGSVQQAKFQIEEAVCRMCNVPFTQDDAHIYSLLTAGESVGDLEIRFFALFRQAQYHYLKAESYFVDHVRGNAQKLSQNHTFDKLSDSKEEFDTCILRIKEAIELYDSWGKPKRRKNDEAKVARIELQIRHTRCYEWYAKIAKEILRGAKSPRQRKIQFQNIIDNLKAAVEAINVAVEILSQIRDIRVRTYNNLDLETYNVKVWCLRLMHEYYLREHDISVQRADKLKAQESAKIVVQQAQETYGKLMESCVNSEIKKKLEGTPEGRVRERLQDLIHEFEAGTVDENTVIKLQDCTMFELRVLDTIIGFRLISTHSFTRSTNISANVAADFNNELRTRLVRIAAKGDFSFNSYFAYSLLTKHRIY